MVIYLTCIVVFYNFITMNYKMASLVTGYEYDIFISYRQKDNKHDGWVTDFVNNLKGELESTFKEDISVYFDINPHDGLLETHDVDASLKDKLKCLVFIPVVSRTYCDPKSFAWEHEFKAFVELASQDQFGLKVKLTNGNVASRVLPVRIHDLDPSDIRLFELILDGVLRGIEFVYEEPGVNRPLTPGDDENKNLKKTRFKNQINKVALAVSEIFRGLETEPEWQKFEKRIEKDEIKQHKALTEKETNTERRASIRKTLSKFLVGALGIAVFISILLFTWPKIFKKSTIEKLRSSGNRISVAVMPFQNMTNDTTWNVWQDGIQNELINNLTNTEELKVRQTESIGAILQGRGITNYSSITPSLASNLSQKLEANVLVYGSIKQAGPTIRISAQLINSKTEEVFKSFHVEGTTDNILHVVDSLSIEVKDFLIISKLEKELSSDFLRLVSTKSPEAFKYFISGKNAFFRRDYSTARSFLLKAIALDSNFYYAAGMIAFTYGNQYDYKEAKKWILKLYPKRDQMSALSKNLINFTYAAYFETPYEEIKYLKQFLDIDDQSPGLYWQLGNAYGELNQYDEAIPEFEKGLEISDKWGSRPAWVYGYTSLGDAYHKTGQYKKERQLYVKAEHDFPGDPDLIFMQAVLSLTEKDTVAANRYLQNYISISKENAAPEADITTELASIYSEAGDIERSEKYLRKALSLDQGNPLRLKNLAWFLIDKDRDVNEGMKLIDNSLKLNLDKYSYFDCKGWAYYRQGNFKLALECLEKADSLKPIYNHNTFLHLEAARKAVANLK